MKVRTFDRRLIGCFIVLETLGSIHVMCTH